ncbi:AraC family transcriptional regulator [Cohnella lupini]|uniref:AraC-like DNA-binding protein n=1 Tax=Cohnella lupini TaxID=1294267 RepID=A0A3D9IJ91_9BACL|nr:AraC family transcriptional regulator [Cohnella lupini]RED61771.1 AraC-like DNA-binding protein [Cohnella lupini]
MQELFGFEAPLPFHIFRYGPPTVLKEQHWHSFYEIGYCYEGSGAFHIGERTLEVAAGDILLFPPYEPHIGVSGENGSFGFYFLYFGEEILPEDNRQLLLTFRQTVLRKESDIARNCPGFPDLETFFRSLMQEYESKRSSYEALLRSKMLELCVRLHRLEETYYSKENWNGMLRSLSKIKPALEFVEKHYAEPIDLHDLASVLSLSESRARHLFKECVGKGFKEYLAFVRIQQAKRMLSQGDLSVTDIYMACGYSSSAPFYRTFQQLVGLSPLQFRNRSFS